MRVRREVRETTFRTEQVTVEVGGVQVDFRIDQHGSDEPRLTISMPVSVDSSTLEEAMRHGEAMRREFLRVRGVEAVAVNVLPVVPRRLKR